MPIRPWPTSSSPRIVRRRQPVVIVSGMRAVVFDCQGQHAGRYVSRTDARCPGRVLGGVGQRLLDQPVRGEVDRLGQRPGLADDLAGHLQAGGGEGADQLLQPGEPGAARARWATLSPGWRSSPTVSLQLLKRGLAGPLDVPERLARLCQVGAGQAGAVRVSVVRVSVVPVGAEQVARHAGLHADERDLVAHRVVQLPGDPQPLFVYPLADALPGVCSWSSAACLARSATRVRWIRRARTACPMAATTTIAGTTCRSARPVAACRLNSRWPSPSTAAAARRPTITRGRSLGSENTSTAVSGTRPDQVLMGPGGHRHHHRRGPGRDQ